MLVSADYISGCQPLFRISASHGIRTVDNLREHCRIEDPDILEVG